jgi:hypothetical protein
MIMKRTIAVFLFLCAGFIFAAPADTVVYVTRTGEKYHLASCSYLRQSSIPIKLGDAVKRYDPCSRCRPPALTEEKPKEQKSEETAKEKAPEQTEKKGGLTYSQMGTSDVWDIKE